MPLHIKQLGIWGASIFWSPGINSLWIPRNNSTHFRYFTNSNFPFSSKVSNLSSRRPLVQTSDLHKPSKRDPNLPFLWHLSTAGESEDREPGSLCRRSQGISWGQMNCPGHRDLGACWIHGRFFPLWRGKHHLQGGKGRGMGFQVQRLIIAWATEWV